MKRSPVFLFLIAAAVILYTVSPAMADDNSDGLGDYVQASLGSGPKLDIAPGIYALIAARADAFLVNGHRTIYASDLKKSIDAGDKLFLMDIRLKADYDKGHIPGAVNIEFAKAAWPENLAMLPADGTLIVVICYTGHTASQVNAILNVLGYNAWTLRFGMMGWRGVTPMKVGIPSASAQDIYGAGYSVETSQ